MLDILLHNPKKLILAITEPVISSNFSRFFGKELAQLPPAASIEIQCDALVYLNENCLWELTEWLRVQPDTTYIVFSGCNHHIIDQLSLHGLHKLVDIVEQKTA